MIGWSPYDALVGFEPGQIETQLLAAGGRLLLNPLQPASDASQYARPGPAPAPAPSGGVRATQPTGPTASKGLFGLPTAAVAGIGVGAVVILGLVAYKLKKKKRR